MFDRSIDCDQKLIDPILLIHRMNHNDYAPLKAHNTLHLGRNSQAILIEIYEYQSDRPEEKQKLISAATSIHLDEKAKLEHYVIQYANASTRCAFSIEHQITQQKNSHYQYASFLSGGTINTSILNVMLLGEKSCCTVYGLQIAKEKQSITQKICIEHQQPQSKSEIKTRGIADDHATLSFQGLIKIPPAGIHSIAHLENKNLLLSPEACIQTRPELDIQQAAVQCTHGATIGHLDPEALFYLQSRGIPKTTAEQLLIEAFVWPTINPFPADLRDYIQKRLYAFSENACIRT